MKEGFEEWIGTKLSPVGASGSEAIYPCPWCSRDKLYVNVAKGVFYCQRCKETGGAVKLVAQVEGLPFREAKGRIEVRRPGDLDALASDLTLSFTPTREARAPIDCPLPETFTPCFDGKGWEVPHYLTDPIDEGGRELTARMIIRHGLGFARKGRYHSRVIVPIFDGDDKTFISRLMGPPSDFTWKDKETNETKTPPKYLTPKDGGMGVVLYWLHAHKPGVPLIVVEGVFDVIRMVDLGFPTTGTLGKELSKQQAKRIIAHEPNEVIFLRDAGAELDAYDDARTLLAAGAEFPVYVAFCPSEDPDTLGALHGRHAIEDLLADRRRVESGTDVWDGALAALES